MYVYFLHVDFQQHMYVLIMLKISEWSLPVANSTKTMLVYSAVYQEQF